MVVVVRRRQVAPSVWLRGRIALFLFAFTATLFSSAHASGSIPASPTGEARTVSFFFSAEAWGGTPFSVQEKQETMARAVLEGGFRRLEAPVAHLVTRSAIPDARVDRFTAVFEVDASARPPKIRSGFELELLVPRSPHPLEIELVNGETGVVNIVQISPEGAL